MTQGSLLDWKPPDGPTEQDRELHRVAGRLAETIVGWLRRRLEDGRPEFVAAELADHVHQQLGGSPESAMRVLRALRVAGQVDVKLLSRPESRYIVKGVR